MTENPTEHTDEALTVEQVDLLDSGRHVLTVSDDGAFAVVEGFEVPDAEDGVPADAAAKKTQQQAPMCFSVRVSKISIELAMGTSG